MLRLFVATLIACCSASAASHALEFRVESPDGQRVMTLPVRVVDERGTPVEGAEVTPWALRCSQGHGMWRGAKNAGLAPEPVVTDADGVAEVAYPYYRYTDERIRTISVSVFVDHPDYAYSNDQHIDVPLEEDGPHEIELKSGGVIELLPQIDTRPAPLEDLFAIWSGGRSWKAGFKPETTDQGAIRLPALSPGKAQARLVRLVDGKATHFSPVVYADVETGKTEERTIELRPAVTIRGRLDDRVARPVLSGRLKASTLAEQRGRENLWWCTWTAIDERGEFTIDAWPEGESVQIIAIGEGFVAASGAAPEVVENPRDPAKDPFQRPQVFSAERYAQSITLATEPLVRCEVECVDAQGGPIEGVEVTSCPNVGWWNQGSQIYGAPLVKSERLLEIRDYHEAIDEAFPKPFTTTTDTTGRGVLEIPAGEEELYIISEEFELPVILGQREEKVVLKQGETTRARLVLQPRGTDHLGDWDKLAGVVFGCSTREGRRICALPEVKQKMDEFRRRIVEAGDPRDPVILADAYAVVAEAFDGAGDPGEAAKWRAKAAEQKRLADDR